MKKHVFERLVSEGLSTREIAAAIGRSQTTVRYWLQKFDLRTEWCKNLSISGSSEVPGTCVLCMTPVLGRRKTCQYCQVKIRRFRVKVAAVAYKGGVCERCGWCESIRGLEFHHRDPMTKLFSIHSGSHNHSWGVVKEELDKCEMLCANCHRVAHEEVDEYFLRLVFTYQGRNEELARLLTSSAV